MEPSAKLVPSLDLVHRVTEAANAYTIARMRILESIPGNPIGISDPDNRKCGRSDGGTFTLARL